MRAVRNVVEHPTTGRRILRDLLISAAVGWLLWLVYLHAPSWQRIPFRVLGIALAASAVFSLVVGWDSLHRLKGLAKAAAAAPLIIHYQWVLAAAAAADGHLPAPLAVPVGAAALTWLMLPGGPKMPARYAYNSRRNRRARRKAGQP